jgi:hypothetical protein
MKHNLIRLLMSIIFLFFISGITGCECEPSKSKEEIEREIQEEIERHREKLELQVEEKLIGNKRLALKLTNRGESAIHTIDYDLKIQVTEVRNAKGELRRGGVGISSQGKGFSIEGNYSSGPDGIVAWPSAISDNHLEYLEPNVTDKISNLVIYTDPDATKATVKVILDPRFKDNHRTKRTEKIVYWELGNRVDPLLKEKIGIFMEEKIWLSPLKLVYNQPANTCTAFTYITIKNIGEHPINLKEASYSYTVNSPTLPNPQTHHVKGIDMGKLHNIAEDIFLTKGETYDINIPIELENKAEKEAKDFLANNTFSFKLTIKTLDGNNLLAENEQQVTFTK